MQLENPCKLAKDLPGGAGARLREKEGETQHAAMRSYDRAMAMKLIRFSDYSEDFASDMVSYLQTRSPKVRFGGNLFPARLTRDSIRPRYSPWKRLSSCTRICVPSS